MGIKKEISDQRAKTYLKVLKATINGAEPVSEYRFHPKRMWRFDFAFPSVKVAVEIDGGIYVGGRHVHPQGYINDMEKLNTATVMGWRVLRLPVGAEYSSKSLELIQQAIDLALGEMNK